MFNVCFLFLLVVVERCFWICLTHKNFVKLILYDAKCAPIGFLFRYMIATDFQMETDITFGESSNKSCSFCS